MQDLTTQVQKSESSYFANGGLADIWKGVWRKKSGETVQVAVKVVRIAWTDTEYLENLRRKLLREGKIWSQLRHPNIVPFLGVSFDAHWRGSPCLISPFYENGNLTNYLRLHPDSDPLEKLSQVASGISYLHTLRPHAIVHGDIKASNVLINDMHQATLSDFGLSRVLEPSGTTTKSLGGTCRWMAYELVAPCEGDDLDYTPPLTTASDVWAFGMTILEVLTCSIPFAQLKYDSTVILTIMRGTLPPRPPSFRDDLWKLLRSCWAMQARDRPTISTILQTLNGVAPTSHRPQYKANYDACISEQKVCCSTKSPMHWIGH